MFDLWKGTITKMISLENIPKISPKVIGVIAHEFMNYRDKDKHLDIEFIEYVKKNNPGITKIIKMFMPMCDDNSYRLMIAAMMVTLKAVDIQIDINKLEEEPCPQK